MAGIPKVKITFDADFDELKKGVKGAQNEVEGFSDRIGKFGKVAAAAFAAATVAAAAYAGKLLVDGVKSAIADEAAQEKLALTLKNVTGATDAQIKATEAYITKTSLAFGVTDDDLRPSLERLARATGDVEKAQKLQSLALDISAGSGKSLEAVSNALAKATEGSTASLGKLGVGLSSAQLKTLSMDEITKKLADTFENQASAKAETFQGKLDRLNIAFDEGKETVGSFVLDAITPLVTIFVSKVIPTIANAADEVGNNLQPVFKSLGGFLNDVLIPAFKALYNFVTDFIIPIINVTLVPIVKALFEAFSTVAKAIKDNETELRPLFDAFKAFATFVRDTLAPTIGTFISSSIKGIAGILADIIGLAANVTDAVTSGFTQVKNFFTTISTFIKNAASNLTDPIVAVFKAAINTIIGLWNKLDFRISFNVPSWVPIIGGDSWNSPDIFPDIPFLAKGGVVDRPTLAMIGEAGPEAVVPLNKSGLMGNTINLTVNGAIDPEGTARAIINVLNNSSYRGTLGSGAFA
jgi:phage-related protein